ncbi:IS6 family transposase, partial [Bacillus thuringiensis]
QDHRHVKCRFVKLAGFQTNFVFSVYNELQKLVATP